MIIYLHGRKDQKRAKRIAEKTPLDNIIAPKYSHLEPKKAIHEISQLAATGNDGTELMFAGNSLGAYYALFLAVHYRTKCVLVNPVLNPSEVLNKAVNSPKANKKLGAAKSQFAVFEIGDVSVANTLIIVNEDDRLSSVDDLRDMFGSSARIIVNKEGGHRKMNIPQVTALIAEHYNS